jgi:membrane protein implicated in regulation of membrane protease activity
MNFDLRIPMGLMFTLAGMVLVLFGLTTSGDAAVYARSLGINANLIWGLVLAAFGLMTLVLGQRAQKRLENPPPETGSKRKPRRGR